MNELLKSPDAPIRSKGNLPHTHLTRTQPSSILSVPYIILSNMKRSNILIESTKTTSMEDVSTGVLEKINNIWEVKIKPKMIWCNKTYTIAYVKIQKNETIHYVKPTAQLLFKNRFPKGGQTCRREVVNPRHQTSQGQSVAKPETPLQNIQVE